MVIVLTAAGAYIGHYHIRPFGWAITVTCAVGGAALGFLVAVVPRQALRVIVRGFVLLGLVWRSRRMRRLALHERNRLRRSVAETADASSLRDLAVAEYLRGKPERAEELLASALAEAPENAGLLSNLGVILAEQEHYDRAAQYFVRALTSVADETARLNSALVAPLVSDPETLERLLQASGKAPGAVTLNNLGVCRARRDDWDGAEHYFVDAVSEDPDLAAAHANLGLIAYRRGQLQVAADHVMAADRLAPREPAFANYLGVILAAADQPDQARHYFRRAQRVDPASVTIPINAAAAAALDGRWGTAARDLEALLDTNPELAAAHYNLAVVRLALVEPYAAADSAAAAIAAGDVSADAYTVLAVALWETGRRAEALSHFRSAASASGSGPLTTSNLGRALLLDGAVERARVLLERGCRLWPEDTDLAFDLATALLATEAAGFHDGVSDQERLRLTLNLQRAYAGLEAALQRGVDVAEVHVNLGLYAYMQEQYERAADHFEEAARKAPRLRELHYLVGTARGRAGEQYALRNPDGAVAPIAVGRQLLRRAVPYLEQAVENREIMADANYNLGRCLYVLEDFERALTAFRKALALERSEEMYMLAALAAARQGQELSVMARGHLLMPDGRRDHLKDRASDLINTAIHYFSQALLRNESDPVLHGNLGLAYMLRNGEHDVESALRHWERMRALGGGAMARRYAELTASGIMADAGRMAFDDRDVTLRGLAVQRWLAAAPPRPAALRFVIEPVTVQEPWPVVVESAVLQEALALRRRIAHDRLRAARLRV